MNLATVAYKLCPRCFRAVPLESEEIYCPNDGEKLLGKCGVCGTHITNPYAHYCVKCGISFTADRTCSSGSIKPELES